MHEQWMQAAIEQAKLGVGLTAPNPTVGAIIVKDNQIVGKGHHPKAGEPHAERFAIADAYKNLNTVDLKGCSLHVTLEPCSSTGKTPPCTQGIIEANISHVIYGSTDPNPNHQGAAHSLLKQHDITVTSAVLEQQCDDLIRDFRKRITTGLPWVISKTAMSLDGRISRPPGESQWLTSPESRDVVHQIRSEVDAIITGGRTLRKDNPSFTIRGAAFNPNKPQPYRAIITHSDRSDLPQDLNVFTDKHQDKTFVYQDVDFIDILKDLANKGCNKVLLECGGGLMGQWFDQSLVDECYTFLAPLVTGGPDLAVAGNGVNSNQSAIKLVNTSSRQIGNDILAHGYIDNK